MKYIFDHDYHIHSRLSSCSRDENQTPERILQYAKENSLSSLCLTDHYWDPLVKGASSWYKAQDTEHVRSCLPLPEAEGISFMFGCETELDRNLTLGISSPTLSDFDFIIIPTTHLHMNGFTINVSDVEAEDSTYIRASLWCKRLEAVLSMPLPFEKIGIAHLACGLMNTVSREEYLKTLDAVSDGEAYRLFTRAAQTGVGIELNMSDMSFSDGEASRVLRLFRIAKDCGCKFYCGSDAHHPESFKKAREIFERAINLLDLKESDKFHISAARGKC